MFGLFGHISASWSMVCQFGLVAYLIGLNLLSGLVHLNLFLCSSLLLAVFLWFARFCPAQGSYWPGLLLFPCSLVWSKLSMLWFLSRPLGFMGQVMVRSYRTMILAFNLVYKVSGMGINGLSLTSCLVFGLLRRVIGERLGKKV